MFQLASRHSAFNSKPTLHGQWYRCFVALPALHISVAEAALHVFSLPILPDNQYETEVCFCPFLWLARHVSQTVGVKPHKQLHLVKQPPQ